MSVSSSDLSPERTTKRVSASGVRKSPLKKVQEDVPPAETKLRQTFQQLDADIFKEAEDSVASHYLLLQRKLLSEQGDVQSASCFGPQG